ncbi:MAG: hypothetical protein ACREL5_10305 [Gemmatimonadales bacterium]
MMSTFLTPRAKVLLSIAIVAFPGASLVAQSRLTVQAGYSTARMVNGNGTSSRILPTRHGFVPGVAYTVRLSDRVGISVGARYVHKGTVATVTEPNVSDQGSRYDLDIHIAEVPMFVTARYPLLQAQLVVEGGATLGLRARCIARTISADGSLSENDCVHTDNGVIVPATDLALTGGFGVAWHRLSLIGEYEFTGRTIQGVGPIAQLQHRTLLLMAGFDLIAPTP